MKVKARDLYEAWGLMPESIHIAYKDGFYFGFLSTDDYVNFLRGY